MSSATVNVHYIVDDVEARSAWYTKHLGFVLLFNQAPAFADEGAAIHPNFHPSRASAMLPQANIM